MERRHLDTIHNEVDVILPRQVVDAATQGSKRIKICCDDKDVFILLIHYLPTKKAYFYALILMEGTTSRTRAVTDIGTTTKQHLQIYDASSLPLTLAQGVVLSLSCGETEPQPLLK